MTDTQKPYGAYALGGFAGNLVKSAQSLPANWLGRRGALILRKCVLLSGDRAVIDAEVDGLRLRLYTQDNVSERKFLFTPQFFDAFERGLLKERLKAGDIFVDVGANAGIYTMAAAALVGDSGRVLSIEPNPVVLERLKFNSALNHFEKRIIVEQAGVSDTQGRFDLTLDDTNLGGSSLVEARSDKKISIECYPLLDIVKKHGIDKIAALKIDIEGAEDKALIPFFETASPSLYPRFIILENSEKQWQRDLKGALEKAGYRLLRRTRMNLVWERN